MNAIAGSQPVAPGPNGHKANSSDSPAALPIPNGWFAVAWSKDLVPGDVQRARYFEEELVLLSAPQVKSLRVAIAGGDTRIVVLRAGCSYRQRLESLLAKRGIQAPRLLEFGTIEAMIKCVAAGLGITLLPRGVVDRMRDKTEVGIHTLPKADAVVQTVFVRRSDAFSSSALEAFVDCACAKPAQARAS